jgi:hypothetical protein
MGAQFAKIMEIKDKAIDVALTGFYYSYIPILLFLGK